MTSKNLYTLVIGASENRERYSNMAIRSLLQHGHEVVAIGNKEGVVEQVSFTKEKKQWEQQIDTITLYLNPLRQQEYYEYIVALRPRRVIFNPGAENPELAHLLRENDIEPVYACTLVLLSTGQY